MYFVYILQSLKDLGYYIGQTEDLDDRIKKHNKGLVKSTRSRKPFILIKKEFFNTRGEARKRENRQFYGQILGQYPAGAAVQALRF